MNITYSLGQAPSRTERPAPAPPEKKERSEGEMDTSSSETSSDDENPNRRARYPPVVKIGHYLNPKTGRWCKTSGRVYNKMLNQGLGVDSMFPPLRPSVAPKEAKRTSQAKTAEINTPQPDPVNDIWKRYGF